MTECNHRTKRRRASCASELYAAAVATICNTTTTALRVAYVHAANSRVCFVSDSVRPTSISGGFVVQLVVTASCATNSQLIEIMWHCSVTSICCGSVVQLSKSPQQVVEQTASLTTSWTTCRTASPQQIHSKLHATISKSYSKSHNFLYNRSTANRTNGVRNFLIDTEDIMSVDCCSPRRGRPDGVRGA